MPTYRVSKSKDNPYVMVNKTFIHDERLSWKAKGILLYFLSRPDDWQIYEKEAIKHAADGRDSFRNGIEELINCGYVKRDRQRDERGRLRGSKYTVYEVPTYDGFSNIGKTNVGKPAPTNNELTNKEITNNYLGNFSSKNPVKTLGNLPKVNPSLSFTEFKNKYFVDSDKEYAISYFIQRLKETTGIEQRKLKEETWQNAGKYKADIICITHFNNIGIKKVNTYEAAY